MGTRPGGGTGDLQWALLVQVHGRPWPAPEMQHVVGSGARRTRTPGGGFPMLPLRLGGADGVLPVVTLVSTEVEQSQLRVRGCARVRVPAHQLAGSPGSATGLVHGVVHRFGVVQPSASRLAPAGTGLFLGATSIAVRSVCQAIGGILIFVFPSK